VQSTLFGSKQVGLFPCRGSGVPCRTLSLVSATCTGTVKPGFTAHFLTVYASSLGVALMRRTTRYRPARYGFCRAGLSPAGLFSKGFIRSFGLFPKLSLAR